MNKMKMSLLAGVVVVAGGMMSAPAQAQIRVARPFVGARTVARVATAPVRVARPVARVATAPVRVAAAPVARVATAPVRIAAAPVARVATAPVRVARATVAPRVVTYGVVAAPVYSRTVVRPAWIPGRPVRNAAVRWAY